MQKHISNLLKELEGVYKYAPQVIEVTELYRHEYHYGVRHLIEPICEAINNIPELLVEQALESYKRKIPLPHPNYFKKTCLNLLSENGNIHTLGRII